MIKAAKRDDKRSCNQRKGCDGQNIESGERNNADNRSNGDRRFAAAHGTVGHCR